jgi:hypothetical protein
MAYCHACGERVEDDARFCQQCGAAVRGATSPVAPPADLPEAESAETPAVESPAPSSPEPSAAVSESVPRTRRRRIVVAILVLAAVLVVALGAAFALRGGSPAGIPVDTMRAALGVTTADFTAAGTHPGPPGSGETWSVYKTKLDGAAGPSWVYLDDDKRVRRVDDFSAAVSRPAASAAAARASAEAYVTAVKGPSLDGLTSRPSSVTAAGRPTTVAWQKKDGQVWVPTGVIVQVGGDGKVVGYQWVDTPVTVSVEPGVSAAKASARAQGALRLRGARRRSSRLEVLDIDPDGDGTVTQFLVWSLTFAKEGAGGAPVALAIVDAQTGKVLSAARTTL